MVHLPFSLTKHRTPSFCHILVRKKPNTGLFFDVAVDERSLAAQHASSRRCMHTCACERMQPAVLAVIRRCTPTRDCVCQHAAVFANTLLCSPAGRSACQQPSLYAHMRL